MLAALTGRTEVLEWLLQNTKKKNTDVLENTKHVSGVPESIKNASDVPENTKNVAKNVTGVLDGGTACTTNQMVSLSRYNDLTCGEGRGGRWAEIYSKNPCTCAYLSAFDI